MRLSKKPKYSSKVNFKAKLRNFFSKLWRPFGFIIDSLINAVVTILAAIFSIVLKPFKAIQDFIDNLYFELSLRLKTVKLNLPKISLPTLSLPKVCLPALPSVNFNFSVVKWIVPHVPKQNPDDEAVYRFYLPLLVRVDFSIRLFTTLVCHSLSFWFSVDQVVKLFAF